MIRGIVAPPPGTLIDWQCGLANKLLVAGQPTTGSWFDAIQKTTGYNATGGTFGVGQLGPMRSHTATSDKFSGIGIGNNLPTGPATLLIIYAKRDTTNRASGLIGFNAAATTGRIGLHAPFSDGNIYWDYGGSTNTVTRLQVSGQTWTAGVPSVWVFTTGPRGMECWRDGKKVGSNSANPTRVSISNAWCLGTNAGDASDLVDVYAVQCWARQLEKPEIDLLSGNPFAVYQVPRSSAFRLVTAGGGAGSRRRQILCC